jgi:hypothetical protein
MNSPKEPNKDTKSANGLVVRVAQASEYGWFDGLMAQHHYLGHGHPAGDHIRQVVERRGEAVGLLAWGPACYALKDRDKWIGWSATQRVERLKLIVQNRRYLLLTAKGSEPNLASQAMGAALRVLAGQWYEKFGYRPALAESFTDPDNFAGTCYKASNWEAVGMSAGYSKHRADFYRFTDSPKKLWLYDLSGRAHRELKVVELPADQQKARIAQPGGVMPVKQLQMESLMEVLRTAPDPRAKNTRFRTGPVLTIIAMALLAGRRDISEIARFANLLSQKQREALGLPRKKGVAKFFQVPSYSVFYELLTTMEPEGFARIMSGWLREKAGELPQALAMDGKMIRDHIGLLTLAQHEDGAPQSVVVFDQKEGTRSCEQTAAAQALEQMGPLDGRIITADALHCQRSVAAAIVNKGGEYVLQIKGNQPGLLRQAKALDGLSAPPFSNKPA